MDGYRSDTDLLGRRNRFRPVLRHETTGREANSGGMRAGEAIRGGTLAAAMTTAGKQARRRETIKHQIVHGIWEDGMGARENDQPHDRSARWAGSRGGKMGELGKLIYTMGMQADTPEPIIRISRESDSDVLLRYRRHGILRRVRQSD